jgi:hypothetical protein
LFTVCLLFCSSESFEKFGLPPEKKTGGKLWVRPPSKGNGDGDDTTINIRWEVGGGRVTKGGVEGDGDGD